MQSLQHPMPNLRPLALRQKGSDTTLQESWGDQEHDQCCRTLQLQGICYLGKEKKQTKKNEYPKQLLPVLSGTNVLLDPKSGNWFDLGIWTRKTRKFFSTSRSSIPCSVYIFSSAWKVQRKANFFDLLLRFFIFLIILITCLCTFLFKCIFFEHRQPEQYAVF